MKTTNQSAVGTSFHNDTIKATVQQLKSILGTPEYCTNDGEDKVNYEWELETEEGEVFTVYDWKEYRPISSTEVITWHIGGKSKMTTMQAFDEITEALNKLETQTT